MNLNGAMLLRGLDDLTRDDATTSQRARTPERAHPGKAGIIPIVEAEGLDRRIDAACARVAPLWPLKHFVAVNPFFGLRDLSFQDASDTLARVVDSSLYMPRAYYREQLAAGRITREDLRQAIERCGSRLDVAAVEQILATKAPQPKMGMASVSEVLDSVEGGIWTSFVTERISLHCAAYFDLGQATVRMPWREQPLYASWRRAAAVDLSPAMMGLGDFKDQVADLPEQPRAAIAWAIQALDIPDEAVERYLHAALLSIGGWAAWARYLRWQAELAGKEDDSIVDLLAIRLMWDVLLFQGKDSPALVARWREMLAASMRPPSAKRQAAAEIDRILLNAMEIGFQRGVVSALGTPARKVRDRADTERPAAQAAFCIDVRSEVFRRSLETVAPGVQTLGFAGFFGIFIEYVPLGAECGRSHVPVIFNPAYRIHERVKEGDDHDNGRQIAKRRKRVGLSKAWKGFKFSATSCFSFVEAAGLMYLPKLLSDSLGWTRPVPDPSTQGLDTPALRRIGPSLGATPNGPSGIPEAERLDHAERILRAMGLTDHFARLVLLTGHGSSTVNNPHASGLDCGACAGQTGEASARVVAALLNQPAVRGGLRERGIRVPEDTWFVAGLHDTTTDDVRLFDTEEIPRTLAEDLARLRRWLEQAGELTRMQRAAGLGIAGFPGRAVEADVRRRSRDWSQVRPEWALANNAAFIAAPRERTLGADLGGRAFLHEYRWQADDAFKVLELIMTAPMVVANWINMQYYGSMVDNPRFGSGNKVLHNIAGGAIGVLEGNGGDLRVGLPLQSLHDGQRWMHEPLRLSVFIEAPEAPMEDIIARHPLVRELVDNGWLHLFRIDENSAVHRRRGAADWVPWEEEPLRAAA
ncbi:MAG: YbcC family protein [Bdellovibrio bacteriovorus]